MTVKTAMNIIQNGLLTAKMLPICKNRFVNAEMPPGKGDI